MMRLGSVWIGAAALAATLVAIGVGIAAVRGAEPRSPDALLGVGGAVLAGLLLLYAVLVVLFFAAGWAELR